MFLIRETVRQWYAHRVPRMGAALSFYMVFSLAPLVVVTLSLVSLAVARNTASAAMIDQVRALVGNEGADTVSMILSKATDVRTNAWETMLGFGVLLVGASGVFGELQDSMNEIWDVTPRHHPVFALLKERAISFVMVLVMSLLMLLSFLVSAGLAMAGNYLHGLSPGHVGAWGLGNSGVSLLMTAILFALIYRMVPDTRILWRDVWAGALIAAVLFMVGKFVLGFYFVYQVRKGAPRLYCQRETEQDWPSALAHHQGVLQIGTPCQGTRSVNPAAHAFARLRRCHGADELRGSRPDYSHREEGHPCLLEFNRQASCGTATSASSATVIIISRSWCPS